MEGLSNASPLRKRRARGTGSGPKVLLRKAEWCLWSGKLTVLPLTVGEEVRQKKSNRLATTKVIAGSDILTSDRIKDSSPNQWVIGILNSETVVYANLEDTGRVTVYRSG